MKDMWKRYVVHYTNDLMNSASDYMKSYEVRPGIYSNVDPTSLIDVKAADFDINK